MDPACRSSPQRKETWIQLAGPLQELPPEEESWTQLTGFVVCPSTVEETINRNSLNKDPMSEVIKRGGRRRGFGVGG